MNTRHSIRLKEYDYSSYGFYFITICTFEHRILFGNVKNGKVELNSLGKLVLEEFLNSVMIRKEISFDEYVVMPNHIHAIVILDNPAPILHNNSPDQSERSSRILPVKSLTSFVAGFKSAVTSKAKNMLGYKFSIWQRNYYEHIIRNDKDLYVIQQYIATNPLKWEIDKYYSPGE
ncbi:MAG TPA: transposase [Ignavibacteriales bacterium]|nr:transposase [Ignavibacteriales bacterium]